MQRQEEKKPAHSPLKQNRCSATWYSFWKDPKLASRLYYVNVVLSILDELMDSICERFQAVNDFVLNEMSPSLRALLYIVPPLIPFVRSFCDLCRGISPELSLSPEKIDKLIRKLDDIEFMDLESGNKRFTREQIKEILIEHREHPDKIKQESTEFKINLIYVALRMMQGAVICIQGSDLTSKEVSDDIKNWFEFSSSLINQFFVLTMLFTSHGSRTKSSISEKDKELVLKKLLADEAEKEEPKELKETPKGSKTTSEKESKDPLKEPLIPKIRVDQMTVPFIRKAGFGRSASFS